MIRRQTRLRLFPYLRYLPKLAAIVEELKLPWSLDGFILAAKLCRDSDSLSMRVGIPYTYEAKYQHASYSQNV